MLILSKNSHRTFLVCLGACAFSFQAAAQGGNQISLRAPVVGLIADGAHTNLSFIQGVPGSSTIGDPIALPAGVSRVYPAPAQQWALAEQEPARLLGKLSFDGGAAGAFVPLYGAVPSPTLVSFSSNGRNAALFAAVRGAVQVITGLAAAPQLSAEYDVSGVDVTAVAISDDGTVPVVLTRTGEVYWLSPGGSRTLLMQAGTPAGIAFLPGESSLVVADGAAGSVTVLDGLNAQLTKRPAVVGPVIPGGSLFVQVASGGTGVVVASSGSNTAYLLDLGGQTLRTLNLQSPISRLERLTSDLFLFSASPNEAAWMIQTDNGNFAATFAQFNGQSRRISRPGEGPVR